MKEPGGRDKYFLRMSESLKEKHDWRADSLQKGSDCRAASRGDILKGQEGWRGTRATGLATHLTWQNSSNRNVYCIVTERTEGPKGVTGGHTGKLQVPGSFNLSFRSKRMGDYR